MKRSRRSREEAGSLRPLGHTWGDREERRRWSDAKVRRVESRVADFVAGLMRTAIAQRRREEKRKRDEAEKEKRVRERARGMVAHVKTFLLAVELDATEACGQVS